MNTTTQAIQGEIKTLLRQRLEKFGFDRAEIHEGHDSSGDPALFIDAYYHLSRQPVETMEILRLLTDIRNTLVHMGETRFPYVRHHFDEKQEVAPFHRRAFKK